MISADSVVQSPLFVAIIAGLFGLFSGGTLVALFRVNADKQKIVVDAAQGAVIIQSSVIDDLNEELGRVRKELNAVEKRARDCQRRVGRLERELHIAGVDVPNGEL